MARIAKLFELPHLVRTTLAAGRFKPISRTLSIPCIGYAVFMLLFAFKRLGLFFSRHDQRALEYRWVLQQLKSIRMGGRVLDVGCAESLLSQVLIVRGFSVTGLDLRDYPFKNTHMQFVKSNITNTGLPSNSFDAIFLVSTIEHVGLDVYGQTLLDEEIDISGVRELVRVLKPGGRLLLTTPFIGGQETRVYRSERQYGLERLLKLTAGLLIDSTHYFRLNRTRSRIGWIEARNPTIPFGDTGVACLSLRKPWVLDSDC